MLASVALLGCALFAGCRTNKEPPATTKVDVPAFSGKQPSEYTWAEYQAMDAAQQEAFRKSFGSDAVFEAWMEKAQREDMDAESAVLPWENGGKQPIEYSWAEFEELTASQQMAFQNSFDSVDAFDAWLQEAQEEARREELDLPWENGGKQPSEYTWAEFEALTADQQMAFQNAFDSFEAFDAWLQQNDPGAGNPDLQLPWENGGKQPSEYTWEEFEALSGEEQMAFQSSFKSQADFDAWLEKNMPQQTEPGSRLPWENGGKQPEDYTWAEFEALSPELQMEFQNSFDSQADLEAWLEKNMPQQTQPATESQIPWENGGKQPEDYTWAEFEALPGELQMAFQNSFDSFEEFEAWFYRVNP